MQRRYSKQRELILNCVRQTTEHPTADMVYQRILPLCPNLSRGTVYRNLNLLADDGLLFRMPFQVERYDARVEPHAHLQCQECGGVYDLPTLSYDTGLDEKVESFGFRVDRHDLLFYGTCPACAKQQVKS